MKRNFVIAMAAALSITTAAGAGIGGYMMGHSNNKDMVATTAKANVDATISSLSANTVKSITEQMIAANAELTASMTSAETASSAQGNTASVSSPDVQKASSSAAGQTVAKIPAAAAGQSAAKASTAAPAKASGTKAASSTQTSKPREFTVTPANYTVYCSIPALNVRTAPETEHGSVIGTVTQGQALQVTGEVNGYTWLQVNFNGKTAYVSSPYVQKAAPAAAGKTADKTTPAKTTPAKTPETPAKTTPDKTPETSDKTTPESVTPSQAETSDDDVTPAGYVIGLEGFGLGEIKPGMTMGDVVERLQTLKVKVGEGKIVELNTKEVRMGVKDDMFVTDLSEDSVLEAGNKYYLHVRVDIKDPASGKTYCFVEESALDNGTTFTEEGWSYLSIHDFTLKMNTSFELD
ncbi:MAG: SH3 domain-containing protein [Lachnospiraceae bacterium]|nr:SH3 domain-containing protein [Lachnospiraceae bacterium]